MDHASQKKTPVTEYAGHLVALHELDLQGKNDSAEADAVREQMDAPWYAMSTQERERMGGLSEDLYAIAQGGPPRTALNAQELAAWKRELRERKTLYQSGDIDGWLAFLRKPRPRDFPRPSGIPLSIICFLQAQAWRELNDYNTASVFMSAAEERDPQLTEFLFHEVLTIDIEKNVARAAS